MPRIGSTSEFDLDLFPFSLKDMLADEHHSLEEDPAHLEFVASLDGVIQNVRVVDFEPGVF